MTLWIPEYVLLIMVVAAAAGWGLWLNERSNIRNYCPESKEIIKARKDRLPLLMLRNPGNSYCKLLVGKKKEKNSIEIECGDENIHFSPEFLGHTQCDLLSGDVVLYHGSIVDPTLMSPENAIALNRMSEVRTNFPGLRCLHNQDLHALLSCPADHIEHDCAILWGELVEENTAKMPIELPETLPEFVSIVEEARAFFDELPVYHADVIGETYESIQRKRTILPPKKKSFWHKKTPAATDDTVRSNAPVPEITNEYVFVNAKRKPVGIQLFSYAAAVQSLSSAYTAQHVTQLKLKVEAKTLQNIAKNKEDLLKWLMVGGFAIGVLIICAAVGVTILG